MWDGPDPRTNDSRDLHAGDPRHLEERDPRDVFTADLDLPRGRDREFVFVHEQAYQLRSSEARALATIGAFRVVRANDLRDDEGRAGDLRHGDLERLRSAGLIRRVAPAEGEERTAFVSLTERGKELLETHRTPDRDAGQRYYAGPAKMRELTHDAELYRAYLDAADRLQAAGVHVDRVVLDEDLKREYQEFLQAGNRDNPESDGRPTRTLAEVHEWADLHHLPVLDGSVQFPDLRIEYEWPDGRRDIEDVEVLTPHYRGAHAAAKARAGFSSYRAGGPRVGGRGGQASQGGRPFDPDLADEFVK
jgi:DNA-binding MarR family transcriptional regulator